MKVFLVFIFLLGNIVLGQEIQLVEVKVTDSSVDGEYLSLKIRIYNPLETKIKYFVPIYFYQDSLVVERKIGYNQLKGDTNFLYYEDLEEPWSVDDQEYFFSFDGQQFKNRKYRLRPNKEEYFNITVRITQGFEDHGVFALPLCVSEEEKLFKWYYLDLNNEEDNE